MNLTNKMLNGYLIKCGASESSSELISSYSGGWYLTYQTEYRKLGYRTKSKALASLTIIELMLEKQEDHLNFLLNNETTIKDVHFLFRTPFFVSANICGYENLNHPLYIESLNKYEKIINSTEVIRKLLPNDELTSFKEELDKNYNYSNGLAVNKGFWSKIFG